MMESEPDRLREAYDALEYELVEVHDNLDVPTATPARFEYAHAPKYVDAEEIAARFDESIVTVIDVFAENGQRCYKFSVSGQAWTDADEPARFSVSTAGVTVHKKQQDLSFDGFRDVVKACSWTVDTDLVYVGDDDGE
jgi:hypothetical protein